MANTKLPMHVLQFAGENNTVYDSFRDYFLTYMGEVEGKDWGSYDKTLTFAEKDAQMHKKLMSEINRVSGQTISGGMTVEQFSTNPMVKWATFAVTNMMIDAIIPDTIIKSIGIYTDIKTVGMGGVAQFDIKPNSLYTVSEGSNARRTTFKTKDFKTSKSLAPVNHTITVEVSLYKVLAGEESLAEYVRKAVISMEQEMSVDAYDALTSLVTNANFPSTLKKTGFSVANVLDVCQTVSAYNRSKAVIMGTTKALSNVLPDSAKGYRINTPSEAMSIQLIKNFYEYDILAIPQIATGKSDYSLALDDTKLYIVSPSTDKLVKGVIEGSTLSYERVAQDNANLTSTQTLNKRYVFEAVSNSKMGIITLS